MSTRTHRTTPKTPGLSCATPTKVAYARRQDAKRAMRTVRRHVAGGPLSVYLCGCGAFHIGHRSFAHRDGSGGALEAPPLTVDVAAT